MVALVPFNRTQRTYNPQAIERWIRIAIAHAIAVAADPAFELMASRCGKVMIGGMNDDWKHANPGPIPRIVRHLFAETLLRFYPGLRIWLLGQANWAVVNGLGMRGLLNDVSTDGSWYIHDSTAECIAVVEQKLITVLRLGGGMCDDGTGQRATFFTLRERMAANLRSLLAAYAGEWAWPTLTPGQPWIDIGDMDQLRALREHCRQAMVDLGLTLPSTHAA